VWTEGNSHQKTETMQNNENKTLKSKLSYFKWENPSSGYIPKGNGIATLGRYLHSHDNYMIVHNIHEKSGNKQRMN
jgi:hypothetical protein